MKPFKHNGRYQNPIWLAKFAIILSSSSLPLTLLHSTARVQFINNRVTPTICLHYRPKCVLTFVSEVHDKTVKLVFFIDGMLGSKYDLVYI